MYLANWCILQCASQTIAESSPEPITFPSSALSRPCSWTMAAETSRDSSGFGRPGRSWFWKDFKEAGGRRCTKTHCRSGQWTLDTPFSFCGARQRDSWPGRTVRFKGVCIHVKRFVWYPWYQYAFLGILYLFVALSVPCKRPTIGSEQINSKI